MFFFIGVLTSCNENKKTNDIITRKPEKPHVKKSIQKIGDYEQTRTVDWHGSVYNVSIERKADVNLPLVDDGTGNKYYDNRIRLCLTGKDGKDLLRRDFTKDDFRKYVGDEYAKNNVLLGVVFDRVDDKMSDEYIPLVVRFSYRNFKLDIYRDTTLDTSDSEPELSDDDI